MMYTRKNSNQFRLQRKDDWPQRSNLLNRDKYAEHAHSFCRCVGETGKCKGFCCTFVIEPLLQAWPIFSKCSRMQLRCSKYILCPFYRTVCSERCKLSCSAYVSSAKPHSFSIFCFQKSAILAELQHAQRASGASILTKTC